MGQKFTYKCTMCGYNVETSGKKDEGFMAVVRPFICNKCKIIVDVLIGQMGREFIPGIDKIPGDAFMCYECSGKDVSPWNLKTKPCPRCGSRMKKDPHGIAMMWD